MFCKYLHLDVILFHNKLEEIFFNVNLISFSLVL